MAQVGWPELNRLSGATDGFALAHVRQHEAPNRVSYSDYHCSRHLRLARASGQHQLESIPVYRGVQHVRSADATHA